MEEDQDQLARDIVIVARAARRMAENFARTDQAKVAKAINQAVGRVETAFLRDTLNKKEEV